MWGYIVSRADRCVPEWIKRRRRKKVNYPTGSSILSQEFCPDSQRARLWVKAWSIKKAHGNTLGESADSQAHWPHHGPGPSTPKVTEDDITIVAKRVISRLIVWLSSVKCHPPPPPPPLPWAEQSKGGRFTQDGAFKSHLCRGAGFVFLNCAWWTRVCVKKAALFSSSSTLFWHGFIL